MYHILNFFVEFKIAYHKYYYSKMTHLLILFILIIILILSNFTYCGIFNRLFGKILTINDSKSLELYHYRIDLSKFMSSSPKDQYKILKSLAISLKNLALNQPEYSYCVENFKKYEENFNYMLANFFIDTIQNNYHNLNKFKVTMNIIKNILNQMCPETTPDVNNLISNKLIN